MKTKVLTDLLDVLVTPFTCTMTSLSVWLASSICRKRALLQAAKALDQVCGDDDCEFHMFYITLRLQKVVIHLHILFVYSDVSDLGFLVAQLERILVLTCANSETLPLRTDRYPQLSRSYSAARQAQFKERYVVQDLESLFRHRNFLQIREIPQNTHQFCANLNSY